jgi:hypothetical protein
MSIYAIRISIFYRGRYGEILTASKNCILAYIFDQFREAVGLYRPGPGRRASLVKHTGETVVSNGNVISGKP